MLHLQEHHIKKWRSACRKQKWNVAAPERQNICKYDVRNPKQDTGDLRSLAVAFCKEENSWRKMGFWSTLWGISCNSLSTRPNEWASTNDGSRQGIYGITLLCVHVILCRQSSSFIRRSAPLFNHKNCKGSWAKAHVSISSASSNFHPDISFSETHYFEDKRLRNKRCRVDNQNLTYNQPLATYKNNVFFLGQFQDK